MFLPDFCWLVPTPKFPTLSSISQSLIAPPKYIYLLSDGTNIKLVDVILAEKILWP
jgi:hypothetical protein